MSSQRTDYHKDRWDKFQILAQASIALAALVFTGVTGFYQHKNASATLEVARSNCELARTQVKASLLPQLSSQDANVRLVALSTAQALDRDFAAEIAGAYVLNDANEKVRQKSRSILEHYDIVVELRHLGLLKRLEEARANIEGGNPSGIEEALKVYHAILNRLSPGNLEKLDISLRIEAHEDEKGGHKELAARKYRAIFQDYE